MKVLIIVASRHGSTHEIAELIATELRLGGVLPDLRDADTVATIADYDAAIIGSAVYVGQWMPEAKRFVTQHRDQLGDDPRLAIQQWAARRRPLAPRRTERCGGVGRVDWCARTCDLHRHARCSRLGFAERLVVKAVRAPIGDFRDKGTIRAWARAIVGHSCRSKRRQPPGDRSVAMPPALPRFREVESWSSCCCCWRRDSPPT